MAPPTPRALVFGATGYIGSNLVPRLCAEGWRVRAAARSREPLEARAWSGVELVAADALRPDTLAGALAGIDIAYYLVHSMAAGRGFAGLDLAAASNFAAAAAAAGVGRIVYLGGLVPADADSTHIVSRKQTGEVLRRGPVPVTEVRAGIIVGPGSAAFEVMRDLVLHLPVMLTPKWVHRKSPPIALDDLLEYLVRLPLLPETAGRTYDAGGPEELTYHEMMLELGRLVGRTPRVIPVPFLSPRLSSYWLRLVTSVPTAVARALVEGLRSEFTADSTDVRRLVPRRLMGFRESLEAALAAESRNTVASRWTEGSFAIRNYRVDYAYYAKRASGSAVTTATPGSVWRVVSSVGGETRYFSLDALWTLRETLDWMVGGPGLQRGRRDPGELRVGDTVDSWRVIGLEPERRLTLAFGMKAPGAGVLEFVIASESAVRTRLTATAYWHPAGLAGLLYWYSLVPAHMLVFDSMTREIVRRAEKLEAEAIVANPVR
jgi:uncharacterized protein YbjT (DUF2867 family)